MFSIGSIIKNLTGIADKAAQIGVNKTDGSNQAILEIQKILHEVKEDADELEKSGENIIRIVQRNWDKFDKRDQKKLEKSIRNFEAHD